MQTTQSNQPSDAILQVCEQFSGALSRQADQIEKLDQALKVLRNEQQQLEKVAVHLLEPFQKSNGTGGNTRTLANCDILASVRKIAAATYANQVFEALIEETAGLNVRSVVFDVRGRAAWGALARGFDPEPDVENLRRVVVALNHDGPFREVFESAESVETRGRAIEKSHSLCSTLAITANAHILLVPIRSADTVAAILYSDIGEKRDANLIDVLKVLAEFAGAQLDRLTAVNGGFAEVEPIRKIENVGSSSEQAAGDKTEVAEPQETLSSQLAQVETKEPSSLDAPVADSEQARAATAPPETAPQVGEPKLPQDAAPVQQTFEDEEKIHRDARRFSRLLVSEIELYNKNGVQEGRQNKDLYQRLKKDIDRSRETYEKRFAHTVARQVDYFHEELVKTLAENDPVLLGPGYPGPTV